MIGRQAAAVLTMASATPLLKPEAQPRLSAKALSIKKGENENDGLMEGYIIPYM